MNGATQRLQVDQFILQHIDSVPHLEALLLLFNSRPKEWSADEIAKLLFVRNDSARKILENLLQRKLIAMHTARPGAFFCNPDDDMQTKLLENVDAIYRKEVVRISSIIHSKGSAGVRDFARAFRIKRDEKP